METAIRFGSFIAVFIVMALWEARRPRRSSTQPKSRHWLTNLSLLAVDVLALRLLLGVGAFATALYAEQHGWGLFNLTSWPYWLEFLLAWLLLDFALYLQHVLSHALPVFWRLHRVHHSDLDFDLTTGVRFHPVEIFLSMLYKMAAVAALGASPWAVLIFEVVLNGASVFNHGNVHLPEKIDRWLRLMIVTPDMHRVHHSSVVNETNSNFGFSISLWDYLCGTYRAQPSLGQLGFEIGLKEFRDPQQLGFWGLLLLPLRGRFGQYSFKKEEGR
ncbi:MAG: sterol desaturase family protein [Gammaproteobacteria bacterium]|nr:sterol desaturase family protein [Gammaproteobacteria bacterium]